jgi:hypothetical protein
MTRCIIQGSGAIELYFYGELEGGERASIEEHLKTCAECGAAFDELRTIRAALAARPGIAGPAGGDWTRFMARLDDAIDREGREIPAAPLTRGFVPYLAIAAALTLVTIGVLLVLSGGGVRQQAARALPGNEHVGATAPAGANEPRDERALAALGEQHFERSKLVVLGLTTRDPERTAPADWAYERQLASSLLTDTRLYRQAAEQHGMGALAGVMRDLELVLLQTSMAQETDAASLERLQRLIRRRDLVTKMNVVTTTGLAP